MVRAPWLPLFTVAIWWLWRWWNHKYFEDYSVKHHKPNEFIFAKFKEITKAWNKEDYGTLNRERKKHEEVLIRWEIPLPRLGRVKLMTCLVGGK